MNEFRQLPPSEQADKKLEVEAALRKKAQDRVAMLREDFGKTFQTEHGKRVLAWFYDRSGYGKSKVSAAQDGSINRDMTIFLAQEETFYLEIRKHIPITVLQQVEYGQIKPSGTIEEPTKTKPTKKKG